MKQEFEEPRAMRELHAIRIKHHEETQYMSLEERAKATNDAAREIAAKYGIKLNFAQKE
jgi:predicted DsbA family dithiol-disulfide isomerase